MGRMLEECTEELKMGHICKKNRKRKKASVEDWNTESVLPKSRVNYEDETVEKGETILSSVNINGLQEPCDRDCIPGKHKKKKRGHTRDQNSSEFHNTKESENVTMSECCEDLERTEEGFEKLPSHEQGDEAEETYRAVLAEADFDPELSYVLRKKLTDTEIVVPVDVPASHCVETRLTHVPTEGQRELLANLGVQLKSKKFTPVEDSVICENWERFSREYGFEDAAPFMLLGQKFFPMKYSERRHFVQYLGSGLPHRTLYSIYARFRTLYRPHVKGKFTEAENDLIMCHLSKGDDKNAFSTLANLLNRDRLSVYKRYKWLQQEQSGQGRITWNLQKVEMVIKSLLKVTGLKDVNDLYHKHITSMDWRKVEKDCGINAEYVRDIWRSKLSTQLFCPEPIYLQEIRIKLIMRLYMDRVKWWQDISWADIAKDFGVGPMFLWGIFRKLLKKCYPYKDWDYFRTHFRATIKDLKKRHIPLLENDAKCYRLQRLRMGQDGKLFVLEEDNYLV